MCRCYDGYTGKRCDEEKIVIIDSKLLDGFATVHCISFYMLEIFFISVRYIALLVMGLGLY